MNKAERGGTRSARTYPTGASGIDWTAIYPDPEHLDEFMARLEGGLATTSLSDPKGGRIPIPRGALINAYRGRTPRR